MNQMNQSMYNSSLRILLVFSIVIICLNKHHASGSDIYDQASFGNNNDGTDSTEVTRRGVWSRLFRNEANQGRSNSPLYHSASAPGFTFEDGQFQVMPLDKRTIPIELQKALYAHGIVGRRR